MASSTQSTNASTTTTVSVVDEWVGDCVEHTMFLADVGDEHSSARWEAVGQSEQLLRSECERIAGEPVERRALDEDMNRLANFFAGAKADATTTTKPQPTTTAAPRTTTTTRPERKVPPRISISCPRSESGDWTLVRVDFVYDFRSQVPIIEWGMDYGDGNSFAAYDEASARRDVYWHEYHSPGTYEATAWVIDENGLRDDDSCTWDWSMPPQPLAPAVPPLAETSGGGCDPNYTGCVPIDSDVDCAGGSGNGPSYTGTVQVIGRDIYGLDGDGDGWGCE